MPIEKVRDVARPDADKSGRSIPDSGIARRVNFSLLKNYSVRSRQRQFRAARDFLVITFLT